MSTVAQREAYKRYNRKRCEERLRWKREAYRKNPEQSRFYNVQSWYGVTRDQYDRMLKDQGGLCAICSVDLDTLKRRPSVDHDHSTGKVRGLLCGVCNVRLGTLENTAWCEAAKRYLTRRK